MVQRVGGGGPVWTGRTILIASGAGTESGWSQRVFDGLRGRPEAPAIIALTDAGLVEWSGAELLDEVAGASELLDHYQAPPGQAVPALFTTRPTSVAFLLAGAFTNRPLAPLGPKMTERELLSCLERMAGTLLLAEAEFAELAMAVGVKTGRVVVIVHGCGGSEAAALLRPQADGTAFMLHTSGTTGLPKQIDVREPALARRAEVNGQLLGLGPSARLVIAGLFHHIGGLGNIAVALANDATLVLYPSFSIEAWRGLTAVAPTHVITVPSVIEMLLQADALALPGLRVVSYGGAPMHPDTMRRIQCELPEVDFIELFGQTEGSPLTVLTAADHRLAVAGDSGLLKSVGRAAPGVEIRLHEPGPDGVGEIWARCAHSFLVDDEGWQHTGDLGYLSEGYLYLSGRKGDKIIRGGENVFPVEVEHVLESHPSVAEAAVVGLPDRRLGEIICAYVVAADPELPLDFDTLRLYCRERLAGFKVPAQWRSAPSLPRNAVGKLLRRELLASDNQ